MTSSIGQNGSREVSFHIFLQSLYNLKINVFVQCEGRPALRMVTHHWGRSKYCMCNLVELCRITKWTTQQNKQVQHLYLSKTTPHSWQCNNRNSLFECIKVDLHPVPSSRALCRWTAHCGNNLLEVSILLAEAHVWCFTFQNEHIASSSTHLEVIRRGVLKVY